MIIEVRIHHPQNEREMNLQSQMQIYLLRKEVDEGCVEREGKRKEKQGEEEHVKQKEETRNKVSMTGDRNTETGQGQGGR